MRFISPKTDFAFKKIFGSKESAPILISFLNAILYEGRSDIESLEIIDPYSPPRIHGMKDTYLDVRAQLAGGETVLIEVQVLNVEGFEKRVLYNAAKEYANQLQKAADYTSLRPVIGLTITDFTMFPEPELYGRVINRFALIETEQGVRYSGGDVELVFAELPKFKTPLSDLKTITEKWLYFLKQAGNLEVAPDSLMQVPEIERAFGMAEFANLSQEEERALQKKLAWIADQLALKATNQSLISQLRANRGELEESRNELEESRNELAVNRNELEQNRSKLEQMKGMLRDAGFSDEEIEKQLDQPG